MIQRKDFDKARLDIYKYICADLIGPKNGEREEIPENPVLYYSAGILFPQKSELAKEEAGEDNVKTARTSKPDDGEEDATVGLENQFYPSAMGISFYVKSAKPSLKIYVTCGLYKAVVKEEKEKKKNFKREPFEYSVIAGLKDTKVDLISELLCLRLKWRKRAEEIYLVTVTMINLSTAAEDEAPDPEKTIFQSSLSVEPAESKTDFVVFDNFGYYSPDEEKVILEMMYRKHKPYAVGHGVSVDWDISENKKKIWSSTYPLAEIPPVDFDIVYFKEEEISKKALSISFLSELNTKNKDKIIASLKGFVENYKFWIDNLKSDNSDIDTSLDKLVNKQISKCIAAYDRMKEGIDLINTDTPAMEAFALANKAMLMQLTHSSEIKKLKPEKNLNLSSIDYSDPEKIIKWRPFQLGFFLLSLPSIVSGRHRKILDLIWFPTGGGKTEAYLAITAFTICYLRMTKKEKAYGTNVLTRYTLRALTAQQFQRSATLICALELLRQKNPKKIGSAKIRLGLLVGSGSSPNTISQNYREDDTCAKEVYKSIDKPGDYQSPFQLQNCPWCNHEIIPRKSLSNDHWGIRINDDLFEFFCPNKECSFNDLIPCNIVDEMIYRNPPSMVVGTIDKFARLTWEPKMYSIFGEGEKMPPALIIQDELHLISGPLGSVMGIYETIVDELCTYGGVKPKIIASTATTRNSYEQCKALFNRASEIFPPSGLNADDSFYAKVKNEEGRLYCGILNPGKSGLTSTVRLFAALLQGVHELPMDKGVKDNFYTLVAYYNSLRELGKNLTLAVDDIPDRMGVIAVDTANVREFNHREFSSKIPSKELPDIIERLKIKMNSRSFIDFLLSTNMISVGIDIERLGLMAVNGQPKTAAEYIQATSRIGRLNPGLVTVLFSPTRIRDRSHYEKFKAFHSVFYKEVEPSGVTPFSKNVLDRALHALFIIIARQYTDLKQNDAAGNFKADHHSVKRFKDVLQTRINEIDPESFELAISQLEEFINANWENNAKEYGSSFRYSKSSTQRQFHRLIRDFGSSEVEGKPTLNSFRNVDYDVSLTEINIL
jgi:hypothetical protein